MGRYLDIAHGVEGEAKTARDSTDKAIRSARVQDTIPDPDGPCPACNSGQWWQLPGEPWHCRHCEPMSGEDNRRATTLTSPLPCARSAACARPCAPRA